MASSLPAGRSPLRAHLSRRQQPPSISGAASSHLRHLHQVATWASLLVPPLGAFLGSRLASTSEILGCPAPSSPHFICQRCESILQVGMNCSVRVRTRKSKKQGTVTKGVSAPINSFKYSCQHCAFESVMSGTSKAYVKTKLSELAACCKLSEPHQSLDVCVAEKPVKVSSSEILSSPKFLTESPGSTSKKTRRKGWLSLKQLSSSSADLSPAGSMLVCSPRSTNIPLLPQLKRLDSARIMPTFSQVDLKCLKPTSGIEGEFCIKTMLEVEQSDGGIGSEKVASFKVINADLSKLEQSLAITAHVGHSNGDTKSFHVPQSKVSDSSGVATTLWSDAEVVLPISSNSGEFICLQKPPASTPDLLQQSDASGITMNVEDGLQQKLSIHHIDVDVAMLEQSGVLSSDLKCSLQDTISTCEAQRNLSCAVSRTDLAIVAPASSLQGLPLIVENSVDHCSEKAFSFPVNDKEVTTTNKIVSLNPSIAKAVESKKRQRDDNKNWCNFHRKQENWKPEADRLRLGEMDIKQTSRVGLSGSRVRRNINTQTLAQEGKVKARTTKKKKKPLFKRVGRRWFTSDDKSSRWRMI